MRIIIFISLKKLHFTIIILAAQITFVGVDMIKPHSQVVNERPHAKFQPHCPSISFCGCGYDKTTPTLVNNAHPGTWRSHTKFQPDWSSGLAMKATLAYI